MKGWIYILSNQSVPDWLAIGCSETDPEALLRQYGNSGIKLPYPFELQYALRTPYPKSQLQKIHDELADECVNPDHNQDWFECDLLRGIRTVRNIAGNSATGEAFYNQARKLAEQAQSDEEYVVAASSALPDNDSSREVQQIRTVPEIQRGKRPSPIAPQVRPNPPPPPPPEPEAPPPPAKEEPKWLVSLLIVVLVCLLMIAVFLVFYLYGYI